MAETQISFLYTGADDPRARPLVDELSREYDERYGLNDGIPSSVELSRYPPELPARSPRGRGRRRRCLQAHG
jgi:hypothetical protein